MFKNLYIHQAHELALFSIKKDKELLGYMITFSFDLCSIENGWDPRRFIPHPKKSNASAFAPSGALVAP